NPISDVSDTSDLFAMSISLPAAEDDPDEGEEPAFEDDTEPSGADPVDEDVEDLEPEDEPESPEDDSQTQPRSRGEFSEEDLYRYATLVSQNPKNISQVPRRAQGQVVEQIVAATYQLARMQAQQAF